MKTCNECPYSSTLPAFLPMDSWAAKEVESYFAGYRKALQNYAWWKDGVEFVGSGREKLKDALDDAVHLRDRNLIELAKRGRGEVAF